MSTKHSKRHPGLQEHSVGELYPWSVMSRGTKASWRCIPFNGITGAEGPEFNVKALGFHVAYTGAEAWIRRQSYRRPYVDVMQELSGLTGCPDLADLVDTSEYTDDGPKRLSDSHRLN